MATIIAWQHSDGRRLPFNHPDARAERLKALADLKGRYPEIKPLSTKPPRRKDGKLISDE